MPDLRPRRRWHHLWKNFAAIGLFPCWGCRRRPASDLSVVPPMANFTGLAAARHALLSASGWDVEAMGLFGAPEVTVVVGEEVHVSVLKALSMLGLGRDRVVRVAVDGQGSMQANFDPPHFRPDDHLYPGRQCQIPALLSPAGEVCSIARKSGAWVHVDGAFGLWAAAAPHRAHLVQGIENTLIPGQTDAHKLVKCPLRQRSGFRPRCPAFRSRHVGKRRISAGRGERRDPHPFRA